MSAANPVTADPSEDAPALHAKVEVRVSEELKAKAQAKAQAEGTTVSAKLRRGLENYVAGWEPDA